MTLRLSFTQRLSWPLLKRTRFENVIKRGGFPKRLGSVRRSARPDRFENGYVLEQIGWLAKSKHDEPPRRAALA